MRRGGGGVGIFLIESLLGRDLGLPSVFWPWGRGVTAQGAGPNGQMNKADFEWCLDVTLGTTGSLLKLMTSTR